MHIAYLYIIKTSLLGAHKIGKSGNWHWTKPGGFYLEGPSHSQLLTKAKSFLWRALLYQTILVFFAKLRSCRTTCLWKHQTNHVLKIHILHMHHKMFYSIESFCTKLRCTYAYVHVGCAHEIQFDWEKNPNSPQDYHKSGVFSSPPPSFLQNKHLKPNEYKIQ